MANLFSPPRKVDCDLPIGENANLIMSERVYAAGRVGWTKDDMSKVLQAAKSSDYTNLCDVLMEHSNDPS